MKEEDRLHIAEQFLASRELTPPWHKGFTPPREFVSDMLIKGNYKTEAFCLKLNHFQEPGASLLCMVMRLTAPEPGAENFREQPAQNERISSITTTHAGVMAWLTPCVLAMALPLPPGHLPQDLACDIKQEMETTLDISISMGAAPFPWMNFTRQEIFYHSIKALDHSSFHIPGTIIAPPNAITFNIIGDRRYQSGLFETAMEEYHLGLLLDPGDFNLLNSLGVCNSVLNRFEQALEQFEKALEIIPDDAMALYNAGLVCNLMEDLEKGGRYLTRASNLNNSLFEIELTAGILFAKTDDTATALEHLEKAASLSPGAGLPRALIGDICLKKGDYTRAVTAYTSAIKCNPRDPWSMSGLARVYEIQDINTDIALSLGRQSIALAPEIALFRHRLGRIYLKKGWYAKAAMEFTEGARHLSRFS